MSELRARVGDELFERIVHLDRVRRASVADESLPMPDRGATVDTDVVFAGGGLSTLIAAAVAARGRRVVVCERAKAGVAHREWNASESELRALVDGGIVNEEELRALVVARYRYGTCQFYPGPRYEVRRVLDHAVDAGSLLAHVRKVAERRGVVFLDGAHVVAIGAGRDAVRVGYEHAGQRQEILASVMVDARGASSPYAKADLICPTVGGVMRGIREGRGEREIDPEVGEILTTTEGIDEGRQHVWEAFPGRAGETSIYLFYYANAGESGSLEALYSRFFRTLGHYKDGEAVLLRPTFGYIPGWSRLTPPPRSPSPRVLLVGDAAARHSPLTFCGFGAMLRSFTLAARAIDAALAENSVSARSIVHDTALHGFTGPLAKLMAGHGFRGNELNELLDAAFGTLHEQGGDIFGELLRDEMRARDFYRFLMATSKKRPGVYREVLRDLGVASLSMWGLSLAKEMWRE